MSRQKSSNLTFINLLRNSQKSLTEKSGRFFKRGSALLKLASISTGRVTKLITVLGFTQRVLEKLSGYFLLLMTLKKGEIIYLYSLQQTP